MPRRLLIAIVVALIGCESPTNQGAQDAAAGGDGGSGSASGGVSPSGGAVTGGGTGPTGGSSAGTGGTSPGGGGGAASSYEQPVWTSIAEIGGCNVLRMANPEKVEPAFGWTSCGDGCDDGELQTWGIMPGGHWITPSVRGTGGQARIALQVMPRRDFDAPYLALLVDQNGTLLQAVKTEGMDEEKCAVAAASVWGDIFSVDMSRSGEGQIQDVFVGLLPLAGDEGIRVSSVGLRHTVPQAM